MKNKISKYFFTIAASAAILTAAAMPASANDIEKSEPKQNIVEVAAAAGSFTILAKALEAAGLTETLKSGKFTVFAPSDEAFQALPPGTLDALLADKEKLKKVLLFHVVEGKKTAADVTKLTEIKTVNNLTAKIKAKPDKVKIAGARIIKTDIAATNGIIHVVDRVMIPTE